MEVASAGLGSTLDRSRDATVGLEAVRSPCRAREPSGQAQEATLPSWLRVRHGGCSTRRLGNQPRRVPRNGTQYAAIVILRIHHKGLRRRYASGSTAGVPTDHAETIVRMPTASSVATQPHDLGFARWTLHRLQAARRDRRASHGTTNRRITFRFEEFNVTDLDLEDDHRRLGKRKLP